MRKSLRRIAEYSIPGEPVQSPDTQVIKYCGTADKGLPSKALPALNGPYFHALVHRPGASVCSGDGAPQV